MPQSSSNVAAANAKEFCSAGDGYIEGKKSKTAGESRKLLTTQVDPMITTPKVKTSGIDDLLAGQGFSFEFQASEELKFMSALEVLQTSNEHTKCKFQGVLVYIDKEPRSVMKEPQSPSRKRDAGYCALLGGKK